MAQLVVRGCYGAEHVPPDADAEMIFAKNFSRQPLGKVTTSFAAKEAFSAYQVEKKDPIPSIEEVC